MTSPTPAPAVVTCDYCDKAAVAQLLFYFVCEDHNLKGK